MACIEYSNTSQNGRIHTNVMLLERNSQPSWTWMVIDNLWKSWMWKSENSAFRHVRSVGTEWGNLLGIFGLRLLLFTSCRFLFFLLLIFSVQIAVQFANDRLPVHRFDQFNCFGGLTKMSITVHHHCSPNTRFKRKLENEFSTGLVDLPFARCNYHHHLCYPTIIP